MRRSYFRIASSTFISLLLLSSSAAADKVCIKPALKKGKVTLTRKVFPGDKCGKGFTEVSEVSTPAPSVFGDGSSGAFGATTSSPFGQYSSIDINATSYPSGLTLPSGSTYRSSGDCTISTQIRISTVAVSGAAPTSGTPAAIPSAGLTPSSAGNGQGAVGTVLLYGGQGGSGLFGSSNFAAIASAPIAFGGGGGGAGYVSIDRSGGGSFRLVCKGAIHITATGSIDASGDSGIDTGGGGGGGAAILISKTSIVNDGHIYARGGVGKDGSAHEAASGGGGGGLVRFIAPLVTAGSCDVSGGSAGALHPITSLGVQYFSGGGGGGSIGSGGGGATVMDDGQGTTVSVGAGEDGVQDQVISSSPEPFAY